MTSTWIFAGASSHTEARVDEYLEMVAATDTPHPFELHLIFLTDAIASWREYFIYLSDQLGAIVSYTHHEVSPAS